VSRERRESLREEECLKPKLKNCNRVTAGEIIVYGIPMGVFRSHELEFANSNVNNPTEMRFQNYAT